MVIARPEAVPIHSKHNEIINLFMQKKLLIYKFRKKISYKHYGPPFYFASTCNNRVMSKILQLKLAEIT
jgi:hypothetical protein